MVTEPSPDITAPPQPNGLGRLEVTLSLASGVLLGSLALILVSWAIGLAVGANGAFLRPAFKGLDYLGRGLSERSLLDLEPETALYSALLTTWAGCAIASLALLARAPPRSQLRRGEVWAVVGAVVVIALSFGTTASTAPLALLCIPLAVVAYRWGCQPTPCPCGHRPASFKAPLWKHCPSCREVRTRPVPPRAEVWLARLRVGLLVAGPLLALLGAVIHTRSGWSDGSSLTRAVPRFGAILSVVDAGALVLPVSLVGFVVGIRRWPLRALLSVGAAAGLLIVANPWGYSRGFRAAHSQLYAALDVATLHRAAQRLVASVQPPLSLEGGDPRLPPELAPCQQVTVWPNVVAAQFGRGWDEREGVLLLLDGREPADLVARNQAMKASREIEALWGDQPAVRYLIEWDEERALEDLVE